MTKTTKKDEKYEEGEIDQEVGEKYGELVTKYSS
jgi:hypothetical protein